MIKIGRNKKKATHLKKKEEKTRRAKRREINVEAWVDKHIEDFVTLSGLDMLGLSIETYKEILNDILIQLFGSTTSYTNVKTLVKRYIRNKNKLDQVIAARIAYLLESFSDEQLEYIVYNIGDSVLYLAPKLYIAAKKAGREDLISIMRSKWNLYWVKKKTNILPAPCPKCGFNSLTPDLMCMVCGATVNEKELKKYIGFTQLLKELAKDLNCDDLDKLSKYEYVLLEDSRIKAPWDKKHPLDIEIYLSPREKDLIIDALKKKCRQRQI